ncbi:hypothetical protein JCM19236_5848 [Vibrio sp. JCM 19236]|nr:hypothetical protein JCM19236_5848 [Vibrio sp. JCM 19236]
MKVNNKKIENEKREINSKKLELFDNIIKRINSQLGKSSHTGIYSSNTTCNQNLTISECITRKEPEIKDSIRFNDDFLNENSKITSLTVNSATIDFNGKLTYTVSYSSNAVITKKIYKKVNGLLGLESIPLILHSNMRAEWYVDGKYIGSGTKIDLELTTGQHGILATYQGETKSVVRQINKHGELYFNFAATKDKVADKNQKFEIKDDSNQNSSETRKGSLESRDKENLNDKANKTVNEDNKNSNLSKFQGYFQK